VWANIRFAPIPAIGSLRRNAIMINIPNGWGSMRRIGLVVLVLVIGLIAQMEHERGHISATMRAMDQAGYGERTIKRAKHSHCAFGEATFVFISQGGRLARETSGYICTGHFGSASIHNGPVDPSENLVWD
jgi:hypothetical protein